MPTLTDQQLQFLIAACEVGLGTSFESKIDSLRDQERRGFAAVDDHFNRPFNPRPLAVRMGLAEREGVLLTRELARHAYVFLDCADFWCVTADGAAAASAYRSSAPQKCEQFDTRLVSNKNAVRDAPRCSHCQSLSGSPAKFCGRCGHRHAACVVEPRSGQRVFTYTMMILVPFALGVVCGVLLSR